MTMKLTAFICLFIFGVAVIADFMQEFDWDLYHECDEVFKKFLADVAVANENPEEFLKNYDCHLQGLHILTPDKMLDYDQLKEIIPLVLDFQGDNLEIIKEVVNNEFEKCKTTSEGGTNSEIFSNIYFCLFSEINSQLGKKK